MVASAGYLAGSCRRAEQPDLHVTAPEPRPGDRVPNGGYLLAQLLFLLDPSTPARPSRVARSRPPSPAAGILPYCMLRPAEGPVRRDVGPWRVLP